LIEIRLFFYFGDEAAVNQKTNKKSTKKGNVRAKWNDDDDSNTKNAMSKKLTIPYNAHKHEQNKKQ
jgi:hypothetical protein